MISAQSFSVKWPIQIEGIIPLSSWWLMVQFVQKNQGSNITLCSFTTTCLPSGLVGVLGWMAACLIPFGGVGSQLVGETL